jgi:hypothetical protein
MMMLSEYSARMVWGVVASFMSVCLLVFGFVNGLPRESKLNVPPPSLFLDRCARQVVAGRRARRRDE